MQAAVTNQETDLLTSRGLQAAGVERDTANAVATVADIAIGGLAGAGKGLVKQGIKEGLESASDDVARAAVNLADYAAGAALGSLGRAGKGRGIREVVGDARDARKLFDQLRGANP